jgi:hypothetical protein
VRPTHEISQRDFCVTCSIAICSQCLIKNHIKHEPILTEDEYQEKCKIYTDSHQEMSHISTEIRELMLSNREKLEKIKKEEKEQVENQSAIVEKLKEELIAETLKLEATKTGFEMKLNERKMIQDKAATI